MHLYRVIESYNLAHELNCNSIRKNVGYYTRPGISTSTIFCTINTNFLFLDKGRKVTLAKALDDYYQRKLDEHRDSQKKETIV